VKQIQGEAKPALNEGFHMSLNLPAPLADYFSAKNAHDIDAMLTCFAADASIRDEGKDLRGHTAIRAWIAETTGKYRVTVKPTALEQADGAVVVTALVSGAFPGSPIALRYLFGVDGNKISTLAIA
jgi:hypothetical protein